MLKFLLICFYLLGVWRFWVGFGRTDYHSRRLLLTLLWPLLLVANAGYRRNFRRALTGG